MQREMMPAQGHMDPGGEQAEQAEQAATTMEMSPDALRDMGFGSAPRMGESFVFSGRAVCRGLSRRGGSVMHVRIDGMRPLAGQAQDAGQERPSAPGGPGALSGAPDMEAQKAFFRSLFNGDD
jgi:hypothetical protein